MSQIGFVKAMKDFFGLLPGQSVMQFGAELRALSHEEKLDFAQGFGPSASTAPIPSSPRWPPDPKIRAARFLAERFILSIGPLLPSRLNDLLAFKIAKSGPNFYPTFSGVAEPNGGPDTLTLAEVLVPTHAEPRHITDTHAGAEFAAGNVLAIPFVRAPRCITRSSRKIPNRSMTSPRHSQRGILCAARSQRGCQRPILYSGQPCCLNRTASKRRKRCVCPARRCSRGQRQHRAFLVPQGPAVPGSWRSDLDSP